MEKNFRKFTDEVFLSNKQYRDRGETTFSKFVSSNGSVTGTLMLDPRRANGDEEQELPVAIRIQYNGKKVYLRIGKTYKLEEWRVLCELERQGRNKNATERKELRTRISKVEDMVNALVDNGIFTLKRLQERFSGITPEERTIYSIWDKYIADRKIDKLGTARTNIDVKRRFVKQMETNVSFGDIDRAFILKWTKAMKKYGLSATTIGISLRTFRAIIKVCIDEGTYKADTIISNPPYSLSWVPVNDERFDGYKLAPKSKADYAFILDGIYSLKNNGTAVYILPHGVLFRGQAEGDIRQNLIKKTKQNFKREQEIASCRERKFDEFIARTLSMLSKRQI